MSPNRVVAVLTPLVFAPVAGGCAAWLAEHFPGVEISQSQLQEIFIAGALIALAPAAQWLHGWQKYEARVADAETRAAEVATPAAVDEELPEGEFDEFDDFDDEFELELDDETADNGQPVTSGA